MKPIAVDIKYEPNENTTLLNSLLDPENKEPIFLTTADGEDLSFDQIATIPYDEKIYCVLVPTEPMEGIDEDECLIFVYDREGEDEKLVLEESEETCAAVYDVYLQLLEEGEEQEQ